MDSPAVDRVTSLGINAKMSELSAAVGLTSLDNMATIVAVNRQNYDAYRRRLRPLAGLRLLPHDGPEESNYQYVVVEVDAQIAGLSQG